MDTDRDALLEAVRAGDAAAVSTLLARDPSIVDARDADGVSALMLARYRFDRAVSDALLAVDPDLDVFEAATLGYVDRLRERLEEGARGGDTADAAERVAAIRREFEAVRTGLLEARAAR